MSTASWFRQALAPWYDENGRPLPWRSSRDPYRIWLSEVILQQTRVDQGMAYWCRFVERYPTVADLAAAPEDEVLKLWQGLGYYSRARNLRTAAQQVAAQHGGAFPSTFEELRSLKGVGDYTAAAIGSICFGLPEAVVDGNVYRVLARVFGIDTPIDSTEGRKQFRELANELLDPARPGDHNQAVMELGATVCTPKKPDCPNCPLEEKCIARKTGRIAELPVKAGKAKVRTRHFNYLHIEQDGGVFLRKREGKDIWQGLYEFPLVETGDVATKPTLARALADLYPGKVRLEQRSRPVTHILSHQRIEAIFWAVEPAAPIDPPADWLFVPLGELHRYAVPRLMDRYLQANIATDAA